jgi:DNA-binding NtrC family response regulator
LKVLFVDDEVDIVNAVILSLEMLGLVAEGHTSPHAALAAFEADPSPYRCVISDFTLPGMSCADFISRLRARRPDIPVHLCTGNAEHEIQAVADQLKIGSILYKPFDFEGLERFLALVTGKIP